MQRPLHYECRLGVTEDMRKLEWDGEFYDHREIIETAFSSQRAGSGLVLVGVVDEFPVAQLWARFADPERPPRLWAFRVMRAYQGLGIGAALLNFAESELAQQGFACCEIGVEKNNIDAGLFYACRGYRLAYGEVENYSYFTPSGEKRNGRADQWILYKTLSGLITGLQPGHDACRKGMPRRA
jgi:GNAT superfamily N-acetyltransferase